MLQRLDAGKTNMMRAPIGAVDHGIGAGRQFGVQPLVDQPSGDGFFGRAGDEGIAVERTCQRSILQRLADRADDIAARAQFAQLGLRALRHRPVARLALGGEAHRPQMLQPADHQAAQARIVRAKSFGPQVDHAQFVSGAADCVIQAGPAFGGHLAVERLADLMLGLRPQFGERQFLGARAQAVADIVARDDEILAALVDAAHQQMDMWIVGVPVIHRDPVEPRSQVCFHLTSEVARVFAQIGQLRRVLGRDDDPEMMPIVLAPLGETAIVGLVAVRIEQRRWRTVAGHTLALQISDVRGQRRHAPSADAMTHGQRLHQHASARAEQAAARERRAACAEIRLAASTRPAPAMPLGPAMQSGDTQHVGDESARIAALRLAALRLARPDAEVAVLGHDATAFRPKWPMVPFEALKRLPFSFRAARSSTDAPMLSQGKAALFRRNGVRLVSCNRLLPGFPASPPFVTGGHNARRTGEIIAVGPRQRGGRTACRLVRGFAAAPHLRSPSIPVRAAGHAHRQKQR